MRIDATQALQAADHRIVSSRSALIKLCSNRVLVVSLKQMSVSSLHEWTQWSCHLKDARKTFYRAKAHYYRST
jgi:hypothetical protein